jgi:threonine aldolase
MNFASDNVYGVHPRILASLAEANSGTAPSYCYDDLTKRAEEQLCKLFDKDVRAFLVTTGTAANGLALSALTPSYGISVSMNVIPRNCSQAAPRSWGFLLRTGRSRRRRSKSA